MTPLPEGQTLPRSVHLLLVEDDAVDAEAIQRAFKKQKIANEFTVVSDGVEALEALRGEGGRDAVSRPYVILLDINMPRMNGLEFLETIRQDPDLRRSVVFVLTTSENDEDKMRAYDSFVAGYILKSRAGQDFLEVTRLLQSYWRLVEFPPEG